MPLGVRDALALDVTKSNPTTDHLSPPTTALPSHRVLLAEDDDEMRALISMRLRRDGYDLVEAESGYALFAALTEVRERESPMPSVIVSDIRMPGINGLAVLRAIREYGWRVPVVLITAFGSEETLNEAARLDASIVMHKPFELDDLRMAIRCLLPPRRNASLS
jgi:DNA-binding response OmpR family regulator